MLDAKTKNNSPCFEICEKHFSSHLAMIWSNTAMLRTLLLEMESLLVEEVASMQSRMSPRLQNLDEIVTCRNTLQGSNENAIFSSAVSRASAVLALVHLIKRKIWRTNKVFYTVFSVKPAKNVLDRCTIKIISKYLKAHRDNEPQRPMQALLIKMYASPPRSSKIPLR